MAKASTKIKDSVGERIFNIVNVLFMVFLMVITIYPLIYVVSASLSNASLFMAHTGLLLWPAGFSTAAYEAVVENPSILSGYGNTLFVTIVGVVINITLTALGAYFVSRRDQAITKYAMIMIIITMFFGGGLIPGYLNVQDFGMLNTLWALIIPGAISTFNLIILRTSFMSIPQDLEECAHLDGASHFTILFKIFLPLSQATIAVLILYYGVGHWNSWFGAFIYLRERSLFPLSLILREILIANDTNSMLEGASAQDVEQISETIKYSTIVVATAPILCLYPFLQKYFVKGVMVGAVKG